MYILIYIKIEKGLIDLDEFDKLYETRSHNKIGGTSTCIYIYIYIFFYFI